MKTKKLHSLIIGGTRGIGSALASLWAENGHKVSIIGRQAPADSAQVRSAKYWLVDLVNQQRLLQSLDNMVRQRGRLNHIVFFQRFRGDDDAWQGEMETTLTATKNVIDRLKNSFAMGRAHAPSIVMVSSIACAYIAEEQPLSYHVAKAGLIHMMRYYAVKLGPLGIRVNAVSFGAVIKTESKAFYARNAALKSLYRTITPLGRMGAAEDIVRVVDFLCSSKAAFVTGQNIVVDGGLSLQWPGSLAQKVALRKDL